MESKNNPIITVKVRCQACRNTGEYRDTDLFWDRTPDDCDFYVYCTQCGIPAGEVKELQPLIDALPEYEKEEDYFYESEIEQKIGEQC